VRAVVARSFERIHRSNLIGMGVFPLEFAAGDSTERHRLTGEEAIDVEGLDELRVGDNSIALRLRRPDGTREAIPTTLRIDSIQELTYLRNQGILPYVVRKSVAATRAAA
jgi:aconitate hydratase